jgi:hypothetical protein
MYGTLGTFAGSQFFLSLGTFEFGLLRHDIFGVVLFGKEQ